MHRFCVFISVQYLYIAHSNTSLLKSVAGSGMWEVSRKIGGSWEFETPTTPLFCDIRFGIYQTWDQ